MNLSEEYWQNLKFSNKDIEGLYNRLLETESPQSITELVKFLIEKHISSEKNRILQSRKSDGTEYFPKEKYKKGQSLIFPNRNYEKGKVIDVRPGCNPDYPNLEVITVEFEPGKPVEFASNISDHKLNDFKPVEDSSDYMNPDWVFTHYGDSLSEKLGSLVNENEELINVGGNYFPRSLLVDVSVGHLNLAEAVLEMSNGGPMLSSDLIKQIELPTDTNADLTEFSLNYAMQEDSRFDEVGPAGKTLWFLKRLEPAEVQDVPTTLKYNPVSAISSVETSKFPELNIDFCDELEPGEPCASVDDITLTLTYPHWRAGTLPLTNRLKRLFPTAYETPRVKFTFKDGNSGELFNGWVVRPSRYIFGLREWYEKEGFIPGSLIHVKRDEVPGQVVISAEKKHTSKEWLRTFLVGTDGGFVFAMLKQMVSGSFDDRMAIVIPDYKAVDSIWEKYARTKPSLEKIIVLMMRELAKLNPQGHVHAQELYAAVNVVKRCPPSPILDILFSRPWSIHMGDLYFRLDESKLEGS